MKNTMKLKALTIFICSSLSGYTIADNTTNPSAKSNGMQNGAMPAQQISDTNTTAVVNEVKETLSEYSKMVSVTAMGTVVHLSGELPSDTDYEKVVTLAESVKGVQDVNVDGLTVKGSVQPLTDSYITAKVRGALIREDVLAKDIPSWTINIETKNGKVFLSGNIDSEQTKQKIVEVAKEVSGVTEVDDQMVVDDATSTDSSEGMNTTNGDTDKDTDDSSNGDTDKDIDDDTSNNTTY